MPHESRIIFLKEFTKHMIVNYKQAMLEEPINEKELMAELPIPQRQFLMPEQKQERYFPIKIIPPAPPITPVPKKRLMPIIKPMTMPIQQKRFSMPARAPPSQQQFSPEQYITRLPEGFELGKLNFLIQDPRVTIIECSGPGMPVIARTEGQTALTKIIITQEEIQDIIEKFAKTAKIPVISGLFKAIVGNLVITAVVSDLVGTRFIITKITPRFMIENNNF